MCKCLPIYFFAELMGAPYCSSSRNTGNECPCHALAFLLDFVVRSGTPEPHSLGERLISHSKNAGSPDAASHARPDA